MSSLTLTVQPALSNLKATALTLSNLKVPALHHTSDLDYHHIGPVGADGCRKDLQAKSAPLLPTMRSGFADHPQVHSRSQVTSPECLGETSNFYPPRTLTPNHGPGCVLVVFY